MATAFIARVADMTVISDAVSGRILGDVLLASVDGMWVVGADHRTRGRRANRHDAEQQLLDLLGLTQLGAVQPYPRSRMTPRQVEAAEAYDRLQNA